MRVLIYQQGCILINWNSLLKQLQTANSQSRPVPTYSCALLLSVSVFGQNVLKKPANDKQFNSFLTDEEAVGYVPRNTEKTTKWALRNFEEWQEVRNRPFPSDQVPSDLLTNSSMESCTLCRWLSYFVVETRNGRGEEYTPATLNQLLVRHIPKRPSTKRFAYQ